MKAYNFSMLNTREKKIYSFGDVNLSKSGIDSRFLIIAGVLLAVSLLLNSLVAALIGNWYFSPFKEDGLDMQPLMFVAGIPIGLAAGLFYIKLNNYRAIDFLIIYFSPKKTLDISGKQIEIISYNYDAFLEKQYNSSDINTYKEKKKEDKVKNKNKPKSRKKEKKNKHNR